MGWAGSRGRGGAGGSRAGSRGRGGAAGGGAAAAACIVHACASIMRINDYNIMFSMCIRIQSIFITIKRLLVHC